MVTQNAVTLTSLLLSVLSLFVALSAGLPSLAKLYINRIYNPPMVDIDIQTHSNNEPVPWYELDQQKVIDRVDDDKITLPQIFIGTESSSKNQYIERVEIYTSEGWSLIKPYQQRAQMIGFNRYSIPQEGLAHQGLIASGGGASIPFPFKPEPENCKFEIVVYTKVSASQFCFPIIGNFPRYFGDVPLEPVSESIEITDSS